MTTKPQSSKGYLTKMIPNLDIVKEMLVKHDMDFMMVITGRERIGKSTLALQIAKYVDPDFTSKQVVFDIPQLYEQVYKLKKGQVVIIDEGATAFFARDAMSSDVRDGVKLLTVMGERNLLVLLCVPSFFIVDKYIREHRVAGMVKVTKRGRFKYYSKRRLNSSHYNSKANAYAWADPCFVDSFGPITGKLWDEYRAHKSEYLKGRKDEWNGKDEEEWVKAGVAASTMIVSVNTIKRWAKEGKLGYKINHTGQWYINKIDLDKMSNLDDITIALATRDKKRVDVN